MFSLTSKVVLLFFILCIVYSLFLAKWGHLK